MPVWHRELESNRRLGHRPAFPLSRNGDRDREFHQTGRHAMAQQRLTDATANTIRDRYRTQFADVFTPNIRYEQMPGSDERTAYAAEYAAYRLGQIDDKFARLIEILERGTVQSSQA